MYVLEVRIRDIWEKTALLTNQGKSPLDVVAMFTEYMQEMTGGMLCIEHMSLPVILPLIREDNSFIIKLECCCKNQSEQVGERVRVLLK